MLQVALLSEQNSENASVPSGLPEPALEPIIKKSNKHKIHRSMKADQPELRDENSIESEREVASRDVVSRTEKPTSQPLSDSEAAMVPAEIQATILANVSYPRQARRRGWEGEAAFRFNINSQSVQSVTMLTSTGYPVLDRAARRGLISMRTLPLKDGDYRLPVVFRLQ